MPNEDSNPFDLILADIAKMKEEISTLRKENSELAQFNKALFERQTVTTTAPTPSGTSETDTDELMKKFQAYLGGK